MRLFVLILSAISCLSSAPVYYLRTDQTGAQTQIDINHTSTWVFTPNVNFDFGGGYFEMKSGGSNVHDIKLALYQGYNAAGIPLASITMTVGQFCAQANNCGQFSTHAFLIGTPIVLSAGTTYFAALTSLAIDTQSTAYFIKADRSFVVDGQLNVITPSPVTFGVPAGIPEPGTWALGGLGLSLIALQWRGRVKRRR